MKNTIANLTLKNHHGFKIMASFKGTKALQGDESSINRHYSIKVKSNETGKTLSFDHWTSVENPVITSTSQIKEAFACFVDDCLSALHPYLEFCLELGYEKNAESKKIHNNCCKALKKLERISHMDIEELYEEVIC